MMELVDEKKEEEESEVSAYLGAGEERSKSRIALILSCWIDKHTLYLDRKITSLSGISTYEHL